MVIELPTSTAQAPERSAEAEELSYRLAQQQLTAEFALFALASRDAEELLQRASQVCAKGMHSRYCKIMEYLPDEEQFLVRAGVGWEPGVVGRARTGADLASPTGYAFRTGESVISDHNEDGSRFRTPSILAEHGIKRAINVPIYMGSRPFGVLEVDSPLQSRFNDADLFFVCGFASLIGVALERQRTEEELQRKEALLQQALERQELLAKEMNHRVKNSLAVVAGLLFLQQQEASDPALKQVLNDARSRIGTVASMHDRLWRLDEVHRVDLSDFLAELCDSLRSTMPRHELILEIASVTLNTSQAMALGLLVNELVTNAVKYAYPGGAGPIWLSLSLTGAGEVRLEVRDEGVGMPAEGIARSSGSYGRKLIMTLTRQLNGVLDWDDAKPGTRCVLTFAPAGTG